MPTPRIRPAVPALRGLMLLLSVLALLITAPATPGPAGSATDPLIDRIILSAHAVLDRAPPAPAPASEGHVGGAGLLASPSSWPSRCGTFSQVVPVAPRGAVQDRFSHGGARAPPVPSVLTA